ncbi:MAG: hypothetical protein F6J90_01935 [Moorea sp. SIOASIH]|nr:hypothetical protein [Moorena sp. SIOASIH]
MPSNGIGTAHLDELNRIQINLWWAVPSNGIGKQMNLSGALPTLHALLELLV